MTLPPPPDATTDKACCQCAAYRSIIDHIMQEREAMRKELKDWILMSEVNARASRRVIGEQP